MVEDRVKFDRAVLTFGDDQERWDYEEWDATVNLEIEEQQVQSYFLLSVIVYFKHYFDQLFFYNFICIFYLPLSICTLVSTFY